MRCLALSAIVLLACSTAGAQSVRGWHPPNTAAACFAASTTTAPLDALGCGEIAIPSAAFTEAERLVGGNGPHRYDLDESITRAERAHHPNACCFTLRYAPPPPPH